jgi:hypothetical protein
VLSSFGDSFIPSQFVDSLITLQDRAPAQPFSYVQECVENDIGAPLELVFSEFEREPLGAASIGQVREGKGRRWLCAHPCALLEQVARPAHALLAPSPNLAAINPATTLPSPPSGTRGHPDLTPATPFPPPQVHGATLTSPLPHPCLPQVHGATLAGSRRRVVVKVQYPDAKRHFSNDIHTLRRFCQVFNTLGGGEGANPAEIPDAARRSRQVGKILLRGGGKSSRKL